MPPSARVVGATESAERDRTAIEGGVSSEDLMRRAGTAAAREISRRYSERLREGAVVVAGPGNNGGDGWIVAGALAGSGVRVMLVEAGEPRGPDARAAKGAAIGSGLTTADIEAWASDPGAERNVVVDALLGTGARGEPRGRIEEAISVINQMRARGAAVVALDMPSGVDATTGRHTTCVVADTTLSFGAVKRGSLLARDCCGEIVALDIGLDAAATARAGESGPASPAGRSPLPWLVDSQWVRSLIPPIRYDAHKGARGHLAIVGGGRGMPGAVVLSARAALRSGIGLVRALVAPENTAAILAASPSALISAWPSDDAGITAQISSWANAIVIGPGLGESEQSRRLVERVLADSDLPVLVDADALNVFDGDVGALKRLLDGRRSVITPHAGEFARLAGMRVPEVLDQRFEVGGEMARSLGATVLLKGAPTVVFTPDGERYVIARGTAALGTGGSGDLLAGIAGTLLAQTQGAVAAACGAAWIHGRAAELCQYVRGTTLEDVLYALPRAWDEGEPLPTPPVLATLPAVAR